MNAIASDDLDHIGEKKLRRIRFHVFRKKLADYGSEPVVAGHKKIQQRILKVNRPGHGFAPRTRSGMERDGSQRLLEKLLIMFGSRCWTAILPLVQIVIDVEIAKIGARQQRIPSRE